MFSELNLPIIGPYIDYLLEKQGVRSVFGKYYMCRETERKNIIISSLICLMYLFGLVNGTTGEGCSFGLEERKQLAEEWCRQGKGK